MSRASLLCCADTVHSVQKTELVFIPCVNIKRLVADSYSFDLLNQPILENVMKTWPDFSLSLLVVGLCRLLVGMSLELMAVKLWQCWQCWPAQIPPTILPHTCFHATHCFKMIHSKIYLERQFWPGQIPPTMTQSLHLELIYIWDEDIFSDGSNVVLADLARPNFCLNAVDCLLESFRDWKKF